MQVQIIRPIRVHIMYNITPVFMIICAPWRLVPPPFLPAWCMHDDILEMLSSTLVFFGFVLFNHNLATAISRTIELLWSSVASEIWLALVYRFVSMRKTRTPPLRSCVIGGWKPSLFGKIRSGASTNASSGRNREAAGNQKGSIVLEIAVTRSNLKAVKS
jgi:hypothetical protein